MGRDKRKGKVRTTSGTKKRKTKEAPLPHDQRFVDEAAVGRYTSGFLSRKIIIEKPLIEGKVDPIFVASLRKRGWEQLITIPELKVNETMVREWYGNLTYEHFQAGFVMCRNVRVPISANIINNHYGLGDFEDVDYLNAIHELNKKSDVLEIIRAEIDEDQTWTTAANGKRMSLRTTALPKDWRVKLRFVQNRLLPKYSITHAGLQDLLMLYALEWNLPINVGATVFRTFREHLTGKKIIAYPRIIHELCIKATVPEYDTDYRPKDGQGIQRDSNATKQAKESARKKKKEHQHSLDPLLLFHPKLLSTPCTGNKPRATSKCSKLPIASECGSNKLMRNGGNS